MISMLNLLTTQKQRQQDFREGPALLSHVIKKDVSVLWLI
jgi:hypothetical protein